MTQTLHCLGTAGYHANDRRQTSCYFLPESSIMLDAGSGIYRAFPLIQSPELNILISHAHVDHVVGLTYLWNAFQNTPLKEIIVWGKPDKLEAIQKHLFAPLIFPAQPKIQWRELPSDAAFTIGNVSVQSFPLTHPGGAVGYRLDWPTTSVTYVTDTTTEQCRNYWDNVQGTKLLMHECNFRAHEASFAEQTGHSNLGTLMSCLIAHQVPRVLLTHVNTMDDDFTSELNELCRSQPKLSACDIKIAHDGMCVEF